MAASLKPDEIFLLNAGVAAADSGVICGALAGVVGRHPVSWLSATHPYQNGSLPNDQLDANAIPTSYVIESLAARGPLHCLDGWGYLARAIGALLVGNTHGARHLAYYAELRASLSILASEGIGIFNGRHRAVDSASTLHNLPKKGTHDMSWFALNKWATQPRALGRILGAVEINGVTLLDALQTFFPSPAVAALSTNLISTWGFDLGVGPVDKDERNVSSYNPNDLTTFSETAQDDLDFIVALWECFQPGAWNLEAHLLRMLLDTQQNASGGTPLTVKNREYDDLDSRLSNVVSFEFLTRTVNPDDHSVILEARNSSRPSIPKAMIARAALLLRIATGMARVNLTTATIQPFNQLEDWWQRIGDRKGFWRPSQRPTTMDELWTEIEDAMEVARSAAHVNRYDMISQGDVSLLKLSEAERIGLWHLCR